MLGGSRRRWSASIRPRCCPTRNASGRRECFEAIVSGRVDEDYNEYRIALPDGRVRHLAVSATRTDWNGRPAMLGVLHDISRQRAAMAALRGSEERYRTMIESLNEGVMIFDAEAR
jgi:PAS domain-containing protein